MPRGYGSKECPSFSGRDSRAGRSRNIQNLRVEEPALTRERSFTGVQAIDTGVNHERGAIGRATQRWPVARGADETLRQDHRSSNAGGFDGWFRELDQVLVDFCRRGRDGQREAMLAIRETHPQISPGMIWDRIVYLGLTTSKRPPYHHHEWTREDLELLRCGYGHGRNGASRTIDALLERHPDWSRSVVCRKAKALGLSHRRRNRPQPWGKDADRQLISCEGFLMESVEKRIKRSIAAIRSRLAALDRGAEFFGGFKTKDLMEWLHLGESVIRRLERKRLLTRERGRITEDSLKSLCREHPEEIPVETLDDETRQTLLECYDYGKPNRARPGGRKKRQPTPHSPPDAQRST